MANESKGGQSKSVAMVEGLRIAESEARRMGRLTRSSVAREDVLSGAYEGVVLAWKSWDPERGPWAAHARVYAREYAKRELNKSRSVVQTCYADNTKRTAQQDAGLVMFDAEDGWVDMDVRDDTTSVEDRCAASLDLQRLYRRFVEVASKLPETQRPIAKSLIEDRYMAENLSVDEIAQAHGVTRPTVYKVEKALRAAVVPA